jgi:hypothetical protein
MPKVPAHRRRVNGVRLSTETQCRRSVQPACSASYGLGTTLISSFSLEALLAVWTAAVNTERFEIEPLPTSGVRPPALLRYPDNFLNEIAPEEQDGASQPNLLLDGSIGGELQRKPPDSKKRQD